jgi:CheY-like chemotaxis protein
LSICHELVELMGGVITVSSSPEVGTVFTVMLPAREARAAMALPKAAAAAGASAPHAISPPRAAKAPSPESEEGPLVLVVDDHEAVQHAIQHQLDALACRSAIAGTGEAALEQFASASFDMVLLDCNLPGIDGYTVAQRMREIERQRAGERTPIVAISAATDDAHRIRCFDSGMDGVLGKPLRLAALRELIELWCAHGDSARNAEPMEHDLAPSSDVLAIYRQTMKTDLEMLSQGIARRDIEQARRAAHRISGAAAVVEDLPTRNLARELERRLSDSFSDINAEIQALLVALQSLHGAEAPDA